MTGHDKITALLVSNIPRDFCIALQRHIPLAFEKAQKAGMMAKTAHRATLLGQARHSFLNEAVHDAFDECGISHPVLRGNAIMLGGLPDMSIGRLHMNQSKWNNARRSKQKRALCAPNREARLLVQADMFASQVVLSELMAFVVTEPELSSGAIPIHVVVTDETMDMRNPLFKEEIHLFLQRYQGVEPEIDIAHPVLRKRDQASKTDEQSTAK
jgi:hypothetical protein